MKNRPCATNTRTVMRVFTPLSILQDSLPTNLAPVINTDTHFKTTAPKNTVIRSYNIVSSSERLHNQNICVVVIFVPIFTYFKPR